MIKLAAIRRFLNLAHSSLPAGLESDIPSAIGIIMKIPQGIIQRSKIPTEREIIDVLSNSSLRHLRIPNNAATRTTDARTPPNTSWPEQLEA